MAYFLVIKTKRFTKLFLQTFVILTIDDKVSNHSRKFFEFDFTRTIGVGLGGFSNGPA